MYIKNAPTLYELRHSKYSCKKNKFNKSKLSLIGTVQLQEVVSNDHRKRFQSLIGTVQQILYESRTNAQWQNVSISHRYGPTGEPLKSMALGGRFQSLIGTVQQQCLLRFMFSLYLISAVFQSFSPKKSVNLFIVNSRKTLILLNVINFSKKQKS